nr:gustatory receptor 23 [Papilio dardanus]
MNTKENSAVEKFSTCIVNCIKPLFYVEYIYGVFRFRLNERSSDAIDLRMKILSIAITSLWIITFIGLIPHKEMMFSNVVMLADYLVSILIAVVYGSSTIMLVLRQSQNNCKVIEMLAGIDISLHASIDQKLYKMSLYHCKILFLLYIFFCFICFTIYGFFSSDGHRIAYLLFSIIYFERKIELCVFCQFLYMLKQRLLLIKKYFSKFTGCENRGMFRQCNLNQLEVDFIGHISNTNYKIRDLAFVYCKVGKVFMLINKIYNYLILMTLVTAFIFIIITSWTILYSYKFHENFMFSLSMLFYLCAEFLSIIFMAYYCENITAVNNKLKRMLYRVMNNEDLPVSMRKQVNVFVELTIIWNFSINVYDMLEVNLGIILSFISICTSYLIVIIQINRLL